MKTTFDLPDPLLRKAKALAAQQGRPLRDLVAEALGEKLDGAVGAVKAGRRRAPGGLGTLEDPARAAPGR